MKEANPQFNDLPDELSSWLTSFGEKNRPMTRKHQAIAGHSNISYLLMLAARCYAMARWERESERILRLFPQKTKKNNVAYYEQRNEWQKAAICYIETKDWRNAARCYDNCGLYAEAAQCYFNAGEILQSAWYWAHYTQKFHQAYTVLQHLALDSQYNRMAVSLIHARCDYAEGNYEQAGNKLSQIVYEYEAHLAGVRGYICTWSFLLAELLQRHDLSALLHSKNYLAGIPGARRDWEKWAIAVYGTAFGLPNSEND